MAQMCQHPNAAFGWVSPTLSYLRAMEMTLERLPPQTEFVLRSGKPMPWSFLRRFDPTWDKPDKEKYYHEGDSYVLYDDVTRGYHGTDWPSFLEIARDGLAPSTSGAGSGAMLSTFGVAPPMVYLADHSGLALTYPTHATTASHLPSVPEWPVGMRV